jgi:hypothetical protein
VAKPKDSQDDGEDEREVGVVEAKLKDSQAAENKENMPTVILKAKASETSEANASPLNPCTSVQAMEVEQSESNQLKGGLEEDNPRKICNCKTNGNCKSCRCKKGGLGCSDLCTCQCGPAKRRK